MKIMIAYPPLQNDKGVPLLSQNRQFQYFKEPTYIYPVVPAQAATLLKAAGHDVVWLDAIASGLSYEDFLEKVKIEKPDVIAMETKTPVVKQHWDIISGLKMLPGGKDLRVVLFGDHVTALPKESFEESKVDYILTGGDYDFLLLNLVDSLSRQKGAEALEPGIWFRQNGQIMNTGVFKLDHNLSSAPLIDRELTQWQRYAHKNGNFKKTPGAYIMSGRDCWWGKCTFCSWPTLYPEFRSRTPEHVLDEVELLVEKFGIQEIMDDTGSFPIGEWLETFCRGMIDRGLNKKVILDCNMRFGCLSEAQYALMKKAGFRLVLFGLESAHEESLVKLRKNTTVPEIIKSCKMARAAGLYPHITIMFGYPWETYEDTKETLKLGQWLLKKGYAYTVQATVVIPYPGSKLFADCQKDGLLKTLDWNEYDMKRPIMKSSIEDAVMLGLVQEIYKVAFNPEFIIRRILSVRSLSDLTYFKRGVKKVFGHIFDFQKRS
ncbi:MAG: radical SAM protein [Candidatus Omnitrophota bacterium]